MKLTKKAIDAIDNLDSRLLLASALQFTETWIRTCILKNKDNGPLTTVAALRVIKQETGMKESEILSEVLSEVSGAKVA